MNEVIQNILTRRSVRKYTDKPVPEELLDIVLQAELHAPSGGNHQLVRLFVITGEKVKQLNNAIVKAFLQQELDPTNYNNKAAVKARQENCDFFFNAPVVISAISPKTHGNSMADSANALQNIQLAATSLGLGACWVNQPHWKTENPDVRAIFSNMGMTPQEAIFGSVVIGFSNEEARIPPVRKEGRIVKAN